MNRYFQLAVLAGLLLLPGISYGLNIQEMVGLVKKGEQTPKVQVQVWQQQQGAQQTRQRSVRVGQMSESDDYDGQFQWAAEELALKPFGARPLEALADELRRKRGKPAVTDLERRDIQFNHIALMRIAKKLRARNEEVKAEGLLAIGAKSVPDFLTDYINENGKPQNNGELSTAAFAYDRHISSIREKRNTEQAQIAHQAEQAQRFDLLTWMIGFFSLGVVLAILRIPARRKLTAALKTRKKTEGRVVFFTEDILTRHWRAAKILVLLAPLLALVYDKPDRLFFIQSYGVPESYAFPIGMFFMVIAGHMSAGILFKPYQDNYLAAIDQSEKKVFCGNCFTLNCSNIVSWSLKSGGKTFSQQDMRVASQPGYKVVNQQNQAVQTGGGEAGLFMLFFNILESLLGTTEVQITDTDKTKAIAAFQSKAAARDFFNGLSKAVNG